MQEFESSLETSDSIEDLPEVKPGVELIQQWQYLGKVHPKLLEDKAFEYCRKAGLTSVQSYVYWAEIEREQGKIDFSSYDRLLEKLAKHNLKWVPFLILGPNYATPKWFQESAESVYAECLEHSEESKIQSIWNPHLPKYVDRFLQLVADHYRDCGILESIGIGISGNWGESLYPVAGGFSGGFHTHTGWWCGDEYAISSFREFATGRYQSLQELNVNWGTNFSDLREIGFPSLKQSSWLNLVYWGLSVIPRWARFWVKPALMVLRIAQRAGFGDFMRKIYSPIPEHKNKSTGELYWLDFVNWYMSSMTSWAEFWLKTARKYFPDTEIYLVTGGNGDPRLGADFSAQTKIAAKYSAGIRFTNQTDDYAESFILTRLVSSASRLYHAYFTTEEGGINQPKGVTMRLFDAATSGAKGFYCKNIIGTGIDPCTGRSFAIGEPTQGAMNLKQHVHHLTLSEPIIDVAVLFPNTSIALEPAILDSIHSQCSQVRDVLDLDLVDENMVADGALKKYRFLTLLDVGILRSQTLKEILGWVKDGGVLVAGKHLRLSTIEGDKELYHELFPQFGGMERIGEGYTLLFNGRGKTYWEFIKQAVYNREKKYPWHGIPEIDGKWDGIYATRFAHKVLYYNSTDSVMKKSVDINGFREKKRFEIDMKPQSIVAVDLNF